MTEREKPMRDSRLCFWVFASAPPAVGNDAAKVDALKIDRDGNGASRAQRRRGIVAAMNDGQLRSARSRRAPRRLDLATLWVVVIAGAGACSKSTTTPPTSGTGGSSNPAATGGNNGSNGSAGMSGDASVSTGAGGTPAPGGGGAPMVDAATPIDLSAPPDASVPTDAMPVADASTTATRVDINFDVDWRYQRADVPGADTKAFVDTAWPYVDLPHTPKFVTPEDIFAYAGIS